MTEIHNLPIWFIYTAALLIGLAIGSFLNVVILRLPIKLQDEFKEACSELNGNSTESSNTQRFFGLDYLIWPASRCPSCKTPIAAWQNIPVISYLLLRGKCSNCQTTISIRYPTIELTTSLLTLLTVLHFGATTTGLYAVILLWGLITLTVIDIDHQLLPDDITLPLLWLGLFANLSGHFTDIDSAIIGAICGYGSLWLLFHIFRMLTGKDGMGYGDFKLFAVFGAWLGWQVLPQIIMIASVIGALLGISWMLVKGRDRNLPIPFGPYLAGAGFIALFWGDQINMAYLKFSGLA